MKWRELFRRGDPTAPLNWPADALQERARLADTLLQVSAQVLAQRGSTDDMVRRLLDALLRATPRLRAGWSWSGPVDALDIQPRNVMGPASGYVESLVLHRDRPDEQPEGFQMLCDNVPQSRNIPATTQNPQWRLAQSRYGLQSLLVLPLRPDTPQQRSLLVLYASEPDYFTTLGLSLFDAWASLLSEMLLQSDQRTRLTRQAQQDPLTGLLNRRSITELQAAADPAQVSCLLLLDIDHFKQVNDEHGHLAGDEVLKAVAHRLQEGTRSADRVARWGGEEFLVWLPATPLSGAVHVAETLRHLIDAAPIHLPAQNVHITVSIGVSDIAPHEDIERAVGRADESLYVAKRSGRNRVVAHGQPLPSAPRDAEPSNAERLTHEVHTREDAVISKQLNGIITGWNAQAERLFGYSAAETVGQNVRMLLPADRQDEEEAILQRLCQGEAIEHFNTVRQHKDGHALHVTLTVKPILGLGGTVVGASKIVRLHRP